MNLLWFIEFLLISIKVGTIDPKSQVDDSYDILLTRNNFPKFVYLKTSKILHKWRDVEEIIARMIEMYRIRGSRWSIVFRRKTRRMLRMLKKEMLMRLLILWRMRMQLVKLKTLRLLRRRIICSYLHLIVVSRIDNEYD